MQLDLFSALERLTFQDAVSVFHDIEGKHKGKSYKSQYKPLNRFFLNRYLETITKVDVEHYRKQRELDGLRSSTINREHSVITRVLNALIEWRGVGVVNGYNFTKLQLPAENPGELVKKANERGYARTLVLTPMEIYRYLDFAHPNVRVIVILAILTLLRKKNIQFLNKDNFNVALQQLQLTQCKTFVPVTIPTSETVIVIINESKHHVICDFKNFRKLHERAQMESGVKFWMSDLRRTGATHMLLAGVDIRTLQKLLGQTTLTVTENYLQPPVQHMVEAVQKLEKRFTGAIEMAVSRR